MMFQEHTHTHTHVGYTIIPAHTESEQMLAGVLALR